MFYFKDTFYEELKLVITSKHEIVSKFATKCRVIRQNHTRSPCRAIHSVTLSFVKMSEKKYKAAQYRECGLFIEEQHQFLGAVGKEFLRSNAHIH